MNTRRIFHLGLAVLWLGGCGMVTVTTGPTAAKTAAVSEPVGATTSEANTQVPEPPASNANETTPMATKPQATEPQSVSQPTTSSSSSSRGVSPDCTLKGFKLYGKIKVVDSFPDVTIKVVDSFPDLKVKKVDSFPDECGEWKMVDSFPDTKIKFVDSFPDVKIKYVDSFPGLR